MGALGGASRTLSTVSVLTTMGPSEGRVLERQVMMAAQEWAELVERQETWEPSGESVAAPASIRSEATDCPGSRMLVW